MVSEQKSAWLLQSCRGLHLACQASPSPCSEAQPSAPMRLPAGENLASGTAFTTCGAGIELWVAERPLYAGGFSEATGHYSQMVWASTKAVGCGFAHCSFGGFVTCLYSPPGNVIGQFANNVPA
jgi:hypothetical protein